MDEDKEVSLCDDFVTQTNGKMFLISARVREMVDDEIDQLKQSF